MSLITRITAIVGGITLLLATALLYACMILPTWSVTDEGSETRTLDLWSGCLISGSDSECGPLLECSVYLSSSCAKRQAARAFMTISLLFSTIGFIRLIILLIVRLKRNNPESTSPYVFLCIHFFSFLSGIFGFPLGLSFALYDNASTVGTSGALAIVAIMLNMFSTCLLCVGIAKSDEMKTEVNPKSTEDVEMGQAHPSTISVRNDNNDQSATAF